MPLRSSRFLYSSLLSGVVSPLIAPVSFRGRFQFAPNIRPAFASHRRLHQAVWPPLIFVNFLLALWAYKVCDKEMRLNTVQCLTLIIFQNKLIYLPYIPLGARKETIQEYEAQLLGVDWTTTKVRTRDGRKLSTCIAEIRLVHVHGVQLY